MKQSTRIASSRRGSALEVEDPSPEQAWHQLYVYPKPGEDPYADATREMPPTAAGVWKSDG
jgi:hypothetical protein